MSFRFYRRISILPGVSLNLGKKGASVSVGPRGAKMTFGSRGVKSSVGIPGTGLRYETPYTKGRKSQMTPGGGDVSIWTVLATICGVITALSFQVMKTTKSDDAFVFGIGFLLLTCVLGLISYLASIFKISSGGGYAAAQKRNATSKPYSLEQHNKAIQQGKYIDELIMASRAFFEFLQELNRSTRCRNHLKSFSGLDGIASGENNFTINKRLAVIVYCDIRDCYRELGYDLGALSGLEGVGYAMMVIQLINKGFDLTNFKDLESRRKLLRIVSELHYTTSVELDINGHEDEFRLAFLLGTVKGEKEWVQRYSSLMYRWVSLIAKADGTITEDESAVLSAILKMKEEKVEGNIRVTSGVETTREDQGNLREQDDGQGVESIDDTMRELDHLIGLAPVKNDVHQLANFITIQQQRRQRGMKVAPVAYHCVFTGNPGTGKTTVARILANVYREMGVVKKGHLVETDRSGLVAEYVGQTAVKTNKIIDSALDGVLFIDEAYMLVQGGANDYGSEALATLLKRMEDDRDRLVVILAGYTDEMKKFIDSNPGLQSRFNRYINFPDYSADELFKIFLSIAEKSQYTCDADVRASLQDIMQAVVDTKDRCFGNGRYVRNLFEKAIQRQAVRLSTVAPLTSEMLAELTLHDLGFEYEN